mgnify:CR=1 FL=1
MNGENVKEVTAGIIVLLIRLVSPNRAPSPAPYCGPSSTEPKITGMWIMVSLIKGSGMYPSGVNPKMSVMAANNAISVNL